MGEDDFNPRLGRIRDVGASGGTRFRKRVAKAAARLGTKGRGSKFTGSRYGRGSAAGRMASVRGHRLPMRRMRRVIVKVHIARRTKTGGTGAFKAHLNYIQRDGVERDGQGGELYNKRDEGISDREFAERSGADRHQFRIILSAEDGDKLGDLKETTRQLMARMEQDLGTRLDWIAVDHHNTGHPHTHVVIRGKDALGRDLVIAREYLTKGLRHQAEEIVTETLGPRRDLEILASRQREVSQDRFTSIDSTLLRESDQGRVEIGAAGTSADRFQRSLKLSRLKHLEALHLAARIETSVWRLEEGWEGTLRQMGRKGDIIRTLSASRRVGQHAEIRMFETRAESAPPLLGEVVASGPSDELRDTRYLIVRSFDGGIWHVDAGEGGWGGLPPEGAVVEVAQTIGEPRQADRTINQIAERSGGVYSDELHAAAEPAASGAYRLAHKRRLEALRRAGFVVRNSDGSWQIGTDFLKHAEEFERTRAGGARILVRSWIGLEAQIEHSGATWIDRLQNSDVQVRTSSRLKQVVDARQSVLLERGLLELSVNGLTSDRIAQLEAWERQAVAARIARRSSRSEILLSEGQTFSGNMQGSVDLAQGRMAVIGNGKEFALVPWRREMGKYMRREITVVRRGQGLDWQVNTTRTRTKGLGL